MIGYRCKSCRVMDGGLNLVGRARRYDLLEGTPATSAIRCEGTTGFFGPGAAPSSRQLPIRRFACLFRRHDDAGTILLAGPHRVSPSPTRDLGDLGNCEYLAAQRVDFEARVRAGVSAGSQRWTRSPTGPSRKESTHRTERKRRVLEEKMRQKTRTAAERVWPTVLGPRQVRTFGNVVGRSRAEVLPVQEVRLLPCLRTRTAGTKAGGGL
ncbi:hypothetical protein V8E36_004982 [Tilletia maclaganii]